MKRQNQNRPSLFPVHMPQEATRPGISFYGLPMEQGRPLYFCPVISSLFFFFFPPLISAVADWMSAILPQIVWHQCNFRCRSETCCTQLSGNAGCKKVAKNRHLGTIAQFCWAISMQLRHILTFGKNLLSSNVSSRSPYNMVNFGPLAAEIGPVVWGTPANFNGFRILAALLHSSQSI